MVIPICSNCRKSLSLTKLISPVPAPPEGPYSWRQAWRFVHEGAVFQGPVLTSFSLVSGYKEMAFQLLLQGFYYCDC